MYNLNAPRVRQPASGYDDEEDEEDETLPPLVEHGSPHSVDDLPQLVASVTSLCLCVGRSLCRSVGLTVCVRSYMGECAGVRRIYLSIYQCLSVHLSVSIYPHLSPYAIYLSMLHRKMDGRMDGWMDGWMDRCC